MSPPGGSRPGLDQFFTAHLLAAIRGLTGRLCPLHAEPVIRWGSPGPEKRGPGRSLGRGLPPAGCQIQGGRAMGGDLMARQWAVPGYTELKVLGSGGFGEVVLARHDVSGTRVAIKYLRAQLLADPQFAALFRAEAAVLASLDDPNVVRLYAYVESPPGGAAIVMELVDGVRCGRSWPGRARRRRRRRWWCCRGRFWGWRRRTGGGWCTGITSRRTC